MDFDLLALKRIKIKKGYLAAAGAVIIFAAIIYLTLFKLEVTKEDSLNYSGLNANPYEKFEESVNSDEVKNLVEDEQFKNIKYYDDLIEEKEYPIRENPFEKSF